MFSSFKKIALTSIAVTVMASAAFAQDAVTATAAPAPAAPPEFEGTAEVSSLVTNGNTKNQTTGLAFDVTYRPAPWLMNLKSKYLTTISQEILTQEQFEAAGRGGRSLTEKLDIFAEHTYLKNGFAGVNNRYISSGGLGYVWVKSDLQTFRTEAALGYTHEDRTDRTQLSFMSGLVGVIYKIKIGATSDISHETKYQPNFKNGEDWRLVTETALSAAISSMLSSKIAWKYEHVNLPPAGKIRGDTTTTVSLLAKF